MCPHILSFHPHPYPSGWIWGLFCPSPLFLFSSQLFLVFCRVLTEPRKAHTNNLNYLNPMMELRKLPQLSQRASGQKHNWSCKDQKCLLCWAKPCPEAQHRRSRKVNLALGQHPTLRPLLTLKGHTNLKNVEKGHPPKGSNEMMAVPVITASRRPKLRMHRGSQRKMQSLCVFLQCRTQHWA